MKKANEQKYGIISTPGARLIADFPVDSYYIYVTNKEPDDGKDTYMESVGTSCISRKDALWIIDDLLESILDDERKDILDKIIDIVAVKQMVDEILLKASYMHEKGEKLVSTIDGAFSDALTLELAEYPIDEEEDSGEDDIRVPYANSELYSDTAEMLKEDIRSGRKDRQAGNE